MDHPAEDYGGKAAVGGVAGVFAGDGAVQAKLGPVGVVSSARGGIQRLVWRCHMAMLSGTRALS